MDDLNGTELTYFVNTTYSNSRYYSFYIDTTTNPMKTGEWVLEIYEKSTNLDTDIEGLTPKLISKVRIYKEFPEDYINTINLVDYRP